jgi:hypothetical protein
LKRTLAILAAAIGLILPFLSAPAGAQGQETYKGRLAPVPVDAKTRPDTAGVGSATAVLSGSKLTVNGTFENFPSPATTGQLRASRVIGIRGNPIGDLTVTKAAKGTISGSFDLTAAQVEAVKKGLFYIQISAEKAPEGNVWGWLSK